MADRFRCIVAHIVAQTMGASAFSAPKICEQLLGHLVEQFGADAAFLRHIHHTRRVAVLIAEWPPPGALPDPDPLAVIHLVDNDILLAGDLKVSTVLAADTSKLVRCSGLPADRRRALAVAVAPLIWGTATTGTIGLTKSGGKRWTPEELEQLAVVASLFAQLQARVAVESRLHRLAERDELTGLHNRRALTAEVRRRLRAGRPGPVAALYVDVDRLKSVNDHLGHAAGDVVIRLCAQRLGAKATQKAMVARVGGDEFVVIPHDVMSADAAEALARALQTAMGSPVRVGDEMITRTVSIGVAFGMPGLDSSDDLLRRADQAAMAVKREGGNAVFVCQDELSVREATPDETELHRAADVELQYQPEIDLRTGEILAVEALACWQPTRGVRADAPEFAADSVPLPVRSVRLVVRRACGDFSRWRSHGVGHDVTLCLNISQMQLAGGEFAGILRSAINEFGIDPGSIRLEISEHVAAHDIPKTQTTFARLKDIGVRIAIDDFGGGDIALSQLKSLPADMLKINTAFTRDLGNDAADLAVVQTIIGVAETVGLELTAQGVETSVAAVTLLRQGCQRAQGLLLSSPVCSDAMESLLSRHRIPLPQNVIDESAALAAVETISQLEASVSSARPG